jgi:branched-chain amino acid transport system permease protein
MTGLAPLLAISFGEKFLQVSAKAIALGSLYALVALGFVLVFKATQTVNFAQGAIALAGAWFTSLLLIDWRIPGRWIDDKWVSWIVAIAIGAALTALLGLIVERTVIRQMIGEPLFSVAVITLGLEVVIRTVTTDAVTINSRDLAFPWGLAEGTKIGDAFIPRAYLIAMVVTVLAFVAIFLFFRTKLGIAMRAVAYDQEAAMAQGISVGKVFAVAWGASAALAAIAGVIGSAAPLGSGAVGAGITGLAFRALPAVILGGLDSVQGALVGGLVIGAAEVYSGEYLKHWTGTLGVGYQLIVPYVVMLIVLLVRPYGLWGTPEIRRV